MRTKAKWITLKSELVSLNIEREQPTEQTPFPLNVLLPLVSEIQDVMKNIFFSKWDSMSAGPAPG